MRRNTLLGFAKVEMPSGMQIADVTVLNGERGPWASPPSKPQVGSDGTVLRDPHGKIKYSPIISFASKDLRDRWSAAVIGALRAARPEAFAAAPERPGAGTLRDAAAPSPPSGRWPAPGRPQQREPAPPLRDDPLPF